MQAEPPDQITHDWTAWQEQALQESYEMDMDQVYDRIVRSHRNGN